MKNIVYLHVKLFLFNIIGVKTLIKDRGEKRIMKVVVVGCTHAGTAAILNLKKINPVGNNSV